MRCPLKRAVDSVVVVVGTVLRLHVTVVGEDMECRILRVFCLDRDSLSSGWTGIHYAHQASFKLAIVLPLSFKWQDDGYAQPRQRGLLCTH